MISADSRQIFRHMDIGTDKVSDEIRAQIPHHQIDIRDPDQSYTAGQRKQDTDQLLDQILSRKKLPCIVGGTGLYLDTIYKNFTMPESAPDPLFRQKMQEKEKADPGFLQRELLRIDPQEAAKIHPKATRYLMRALEIYHTTGKTKTESFIQQPVKHPLLMIGLRRDTQEGNRLINTRIKQMLQNGLVQEVEGLLEAGYHADLQAMNGIGYKEVVGYLQQQYDAEKMEELLKKNTHHLAKKQRTRFRRYIAEGKAHPRENVSYEVFYLS